MKHRKLLLLLVAFTVALAGTAEAGFTVAPEDSFDVLLTRPLDTSLGAQQSNQIQVWQERQNAVLATSLSVDRDGSSTGGLINGDSLSPTSIAAGTSYDSYMVHFDTISASGSVKGSITFTGAILGLIYSTTRLNGSDSIVLTPGYVTASDYTWRGLENSDRFSIDGNTLFFEFLNVSNNGMDEIRVITTATPEFASIGVWGIFCMVGIGFRRYYRRFVSNEETAPSLA